jgi:lycopene beta-cyclase
LEKQPNAFSIGTAGGWTKASTGYTFKNDKKSTQLVAFLQEEGFATISYENQVLALRLALLDILNRHNELGARIFRRCLKKINLDFKFLDEETSYLEDLK